MQKPKVVVDNPVAAKPSRRSLTVDKGDLEWAAGEGLISQPQAGALWDALQKRHAERPQFDLAHLFWYAGAVLVLIAMSWFGAEMGARFGAPAVLATSVAYSAVFLLGGARLWFGQNLKVPGGLLVTLAVTMVPVAFVSLAETMGYPLSAYLTQHGFQFLLEGVTIVSALIALRYFKFPFLTAPIAASLWLMSLTAVDFLFHGQGSFFGLWNEQLTVTMLFGIGITFIGLLVDGKREGDFSFWLYLFGVSAFWFSLSLMDSSSEFGKAVYALINVALMFTSVLLSRRVFLVYGSLGVLYYVGHWMFTLFAGSIAFPFALTFLGGFIIWAGVKYHKNQAAIENSLLTLLPASLRNRLPGRD
ncbi:MAG TPA: DUF2157 domain-containing protein [Candidatus Melainabacteria bacterium]|nr:DUF2157 domain-containing protein [Candidatus Melainabacteria bacterium]